MGCIFLASSGNLSWRSRVDYCLGAMKLPCFVDIVSDLNDSTAFCSWRRIEVPRVLGMTAQLNGRD